MPAAINLSVIVPLYNCEGYIAGTLQSVLTHLPQASTEILVIDDGSSDSGPAIVAQLAHEHVNLKLLKNTQGKGVSSARNTGLAQAVGQYVAFIDADDILLNEQSARKLEFALAQDVNVISSDFVRFTDQQESAQQISSNGNYAANPDYAEYLNNGDSDSVRLDDPIAIFLQTGCLIWTGCVFIKRQHILDRGLCFNTALSNSEDDDFWYRACVGSPFYFWKHVTTGYRIRENSASADRLKKARGVLSFRRMICADTLFLKYQNDAQTRYRLDFEKFAILAAQVNEKGAFEQELKAFKEVYTQPGRWQLLLLQRIKFWVRAHRFQRASARSNNGI